MIYTTLLNIAIFQGIVLGVIILKSPLFNSKANKYLAYAIFTLSLLLLNLVFEIVKIYDPLPLLRLIDDIEWTLIFPVFIFQFIVNQVEHSIKDSKKIRWLFVPFMYSVVLNIFNDLDKVAGLYSISSSLDSIMLILFQIYYYLTIVFVISILLYTYTFIKFAKDVLEKKWLTYLWSLVFILLFSWILILILALFIKYDFTFPLRTLALFAIFLIHWTTYLGIFKYRLAKDREGIIALLSNRKHSSQDYIPIETNIKKVIKNTELLTLDNPYFQKLEDLFKNKQLYRERTLNREMVAKKLGISAGYVSQLVNAITGDNFANYINLYRVEAVKEMILDSEFENYSLLAIGLESGFTSKTTFYKAFKKVTGMTPNTFRNLNK